MFIVVSLLVVVHCRFVSIVVPLVVVWLVFVGSCCSVLLCGVRWCQLVFVDVRCCSVLSVCYSVVCFVVGVVRRCSLLLVLLHVVICCYMLSSVVICCPMWSSVVLCCSRLFSDVI